MDATIAVALGVVAVEAVIRRHVTPFKPSFHGFHATVVATSLISNRCDLNAEVDHRKGRQHWIQVRVDEFPYFVHRLPAGGGLHDSIGNYYHHCAQ